MHFAKRNQDSTLHLNYFSANDASYVLTDGVTAPSTLGYRYISTVSYFLMMLLVTNAAQISAQSQYRAEECTSFHGIFDQKGLWSASD